MGRGENFDLERVRQKGPESLDAGHDMEGNPVRLGEEDSAGYRIGFISPDGRAWQDVAEHDEIRTISKLEEVMFAWTEGRYPGGKPDPLKIAEKTCLDARNTERAAAEAKRNWEAIAKRKQQELHRRSEDFRLFWRDLGSDRYPLEAEGRFSVYPSNFEGAEIEITRTSDTPEEQDRMQNIMEIIKEKLEAEGFPPLFEDQDAEEEVPSEEFDAIVASIDDIVPEVWQSTIHIPLGPLGDSLQISLERGDSEEAYLATLELEEKLREDFLAKDATFEIVAKSPNPEMEKARALEVLAEGEDHPFVRQGRAFGIDPEKLLAHAEDIALGKNEDPAFLFAVSDVLLSQFGRLQITASAETEEKLLERLRMVVPGAKLKE